MKPIQIKIISHLESLGYKDVKFLTDKYRFYKNEILCKNDNHYLSIEVNTFTDCVKLFANDKVKYDASYEKFNWKRSANIDNLYSFLHPELEEAN